MKLLAVILTGLLLVFIPLTKAKPNYASLEEQDLFQSDIKLTDEQRRKIGRAINDGEQIVFGPGSDKRSKRKAISFLSQRWTNGEMPFEISPSSAEYAPTIQAAMDHWMENTCVKFVPHTTQSDYVIFVDRNMCSSYVGKIGGPQDISLGPACPSMSGIIHEIGHALGFWHETSRPDRDNYITIHYENIIPGREDHFNKYNSTFVVTHNVPYDTGSIMHYGPYVHSKNGKRTITGITAQDDEKLQQPRVGLSPADIELTNIIYPCERCSDDEYECDNGACIPSTSECDSIPDCDSGEDERQCEICSDDEYECDNGECIPSLWECDSIPDCEDQEDERECGPCTENDYRCDSGLCIPDYWLCDTIGDCPDGGDEQNCGEEACTDNDYQCDDGVCITGDWECDTIVDCLDGSDEQNCDVPIDTTRPDVTSCPSDIIETTDCNSGGTTQVSWESPVVTDDSGLFDIESQTHQNGQYFPLGMSEVMYIFVDPSGNTASCAFTVQVIEVEIMAPVCDPLSDITASTLPGMNGTIVDWTEPELTDNCGGVILQNKTHSPGEFFSTGTTVVTYWRYDVYGNTASCSFIVTILELEEACTDNEYQCDDGECITGDWECDTIVDCLDESDEQNCDVPIDTTRPNVTSCPSDIIETTDCNSGGTTQVSWESPVVTDDSGLFYIESQTHQNGQYFPLGMSEVTYVFVDPSGNNASCAFTVQVIEVDTIPPVCGPSNDVVQFVSPGVGSTTASWADPAVTDNCGQVVIKNRTHTPGASFSPGNTVVTYDMSDIYGNTVSCSFDVVIIPLEDECITDEFNYRCESGNCIPSSWKCDNIIDCQDEDDEQQCGEVPDTISPVVTNCPNDANVIADCMASVMWAQPTATDDSGTVTIQSQSHEAGLFPAGVTRVSYVFVDPSGNTAACNFVINVTSVDTTPPVCGPLNDVTQTISSDIGGTTISWTQPEATDACGQVILQNQTHSPGDFFSYGTHLVTYIFSDTSLNTVYCSFAVIIDQDVIDGCQAEEFQCADGSCITSDWKCDNILDCPDESDERNCGIIGGCQADEFECFSGSCIISDWECDNIIDCPDGEDEQGCEDPGDTTITCNPSVIPESTSNTVTYTNPASSSVPSDNVITYTYTNEGANQFDIALGNYLNTQPQHVLRSFPRGLNNVTVTVSDENGNTGTCQFTYFRAEPIQTNCIPNVVPDSSSDRVTYANPVLSSVSTGGPLYITYSYTNEGANRLDVFLGTFEATHQEHVIGLFPAGLNVVTAITSDGASCQFTYFRLGPREMTCSPSIIPESSSDVITYPRPALLNFPRDNTVQFVYRNTNEAANQFNKWLGRFPFAQSQHTFESLPTGTNTVTVTANDEAENSAVCEFTYVRLGACATDEYQCKSGSCIPSELRCNAIPNCPNGDDERQCDGTR